MIEVCGIIVTSWVVLYIVVTIQETLSKKNQKPSYVKLKNNNGIIKEVPIGFSWTTFFFGIFVPLFRGDVKWFFVMLLVNLITCGISLLIFPFIYNNIYLKSLLENQGFQPADDVSKKILQNIGFQFAK